MVTNRVTVSMLAVWLMIGAAGIVCLARPAAAADAPLPQGAKVVWGLDKAWREKTPTRERVCLNGLWRWQPAAEAADAVPAERWGYFKVPGCWPGITNYLQKDTQTLYSHDDWKDQRLGEVKAAWYQREIEVPKEWAGRRIVLSAEYLNSYAEVYVDGKKAGEMRFPGGEVELTQVCPPGGKHVLSMLVVALPLKGVMMSYNDTASAREVKGDVARRGLCGDVYLVGEPSGPRIADVKVDTSVRQWEITAGGAIQGLDADKSYELRAAVTDGDRSVKEFRGKPFKAGDLKDGRISFTEKWKPDKLWDIHTPQNMYHISLTLQEAGGKVQDTALPVRFGFREFWIDGRDFYLNGSRIFLFAVPLDNAEVSAEAASYRGACESMKRLKGIGVNFVYTHNYGCEPGSHLGFAEILRAADDMGMLVSFSQPHFGQYDWKSPDADRTNGYARHAEFYVRVAQDHPSVVFYSMSHNGTGYAEDMNPDMIDGKEVKRDSWSDRNVKCALRAEAIVHGLDPGRIVYHHSSGNLSSMHSVNFYPNFAPIQELSDWLEHWSTVGVKPFFACEYGGPITWDWTMYRGWYNGKRSFGSAAVPWEFCFAEWNSQFLGDRAFKICDAEKRNLRWETKQFRAGRVWHRWDYPFEIGSTAFDDRFDVFAMYTADNVRAQRTWGISAANAWEYGFYWKLRDGMDRNRRDELKVDWENLQRPGFSADYLQDRYERFDTAYEPSDWVATPAAKALVRNDGPLLAYVAGDPKHFTEKGHSFLPGQTVEKQIVVINNSRVPVTCECQWTLALPAAASGSKKVDVKTGDQTRIPLKFDLPATLAPGTYDVGMTAKFSTGESQTDSFAIHVLPALPSGNFKQSVKIALWDPKGQSAQLLKDLGVTFKSVEADADLPGYDILIVGKGALTVDGPGPDLARVRDGLKVIVFEQTADVLENRLGFRATEYGLRQVFKRIPDHPLLAGLNTEHLRDWRGESTITPPQRKYTISERLDMAPVVEWCGLEQTRVWRCGNWGNVASVLIEKPARGDFLPILDGGFSLQYSPLMEYREGKGMVLFCQMDVTGRTQSDPSAEQLIRNMIQYAAAWKPAATRTALYVGEAAGKDHLEKAGMSVGGYEGGKLAAGQVLIVGPGGGEKLAANSAAVGEWLRAGGHMLAVGLDETEAAALPVKVTVTKAEHIAAYFDPPGKDSPLAGVGPADVHNRDPRKLPLVSGGAEITGDGVLATAQGGKLVFCQLAPWTFDYSKQYNVKRTFRRTSFTLTRLLANMGVASATPLLARFKTPADASKPENRWQDGLYLDQPEENDDPYRFFRW
jgi:hypothetical protein